MTPWQTFWAGIAPEHAAALIVTVLLPGLWWLHRSLAPPAAERPPMALTDRVAVILLTVTAAIHLALPLGHHDSAWLTAGFLLSGAAYAWLAIRVTRQRSWRAATSLLVTATLIAYLAVVAGGSEEPDQVGILTAVDELLLLGLALSPAHHRRFARAAGTTATITAILVTGVLTWAGTFRSHQASDLDAGLPTVAETGTADLGDHHDHGHAARAQAGIIMRPLGDDHEATAAQIRAATDLAARTTAATARYADIQAAIDAGYHPSGALTGTEVHLENKAYAADGRVLDPEHPEALVYAVLDGKAALLGAVYRMPEAGTPGPAPGGPITRWHSHNACFSLLPPGIGLVSPFGGCPALSVTVTIPEMMHVWTAGSPQGPYAESLDPVWVRTYTAEHGRRWLA